MDKEQELHYEYMDDRSYINPQDKISYPPVAISCGTFELNNKEYPIPIGTYGNFSVVQAPPKTFKSYFISLLSAVYLGDNVKGAGSLKGHRGKKELLHIDTEQGRFHATRLFKRVADMSKANGSYKTYALRQFSASDRVGFIDWKLKNMLNIGVLVIDGVADLVKDVNNLEECNLVTQKLMEWSEQYNCHIITVIHSNYGSEKMTGHLGSAIEKKTETQIILENSPDGVIVKCKRSRGYGFTPFTFELRKDKPYVVGDYLNALEF